MGLTILEAAKINPGTVIRDAVIQMFAERSPLLAAMPVASIAGGAVKYNREGALPGVAFRGVNESYTPSTGVLNPQVDTTVIVGGDVDVDKYIVDTMGSKIRSTHVGMKVKAIADAIGQKIIKGDSSSDPREFDGLQSRLVGAQLIDNGATSGGDALSLAKLDETIDAVDDPQALIMSRAMRRLLSTAAAGSTLGSQINIGKDEFGKQQMFYAGLPILTSANGSTDPLNFLEANPGGGAAASTSIYVVSFGDGKLTGIQNGAIDVRDLGEVDDAPVMRTRIEWYFGLALFHGRAAARLRGIKTGAVVA